MRHPQWHPLTAGLLNAARDRPMPNVGAYRGRIEFLANALDAPIDAEGLYWLSHDLRDHEERIATIIEAVHAMLAHDLATNGPIRIGDHILDVGDHLEVTPVDEYAPWAHRVAEGQRIGSFMIEHNDGEVSDVSEEE